MIKLNNNMAWLGLLEKGQSNILALASARIFNGYAFFKGPFFMVGNKSPTERKVLKDNLD